MDNSQDPVEEREEQVAYLHYLDAIVAALDEQVELVLPSDDLETALRKLQLLAAVYRADDVRNILNGRESALLAGALTRSLVEGALAEKWYASRPAEESPRSATLAVERQNIADAVAETDLCVPTLARWNNPLADQRFASAPTGPALPNIQAGISKQAGADIESTLLLPAPMVDLLGMCSHVNHVATWLTAGDDTKEFGVTASPEFAAVLAQAAGTSAASIGGINHQGPVLDLIAAATATHDFDLAASLGRPKRVENLRPRQAPESGSETWLAEENQAVMDAALDDLRDDALVVWNLINGAPSPFAGTTQGTNLVSALPYLAARDLLLLTIRSTYADCSPLMAPTAARMLLEQGSELSWRFSDPTDSELLKRYQAHMDYATDKKKAVENSLRTRTTSHDAIETLLYPRGRGSFAIDTRRMPDSESASVPGPLEHLSQLDLGDAEPFWPLAYKLLTQAAHATPLGLLHMAARTDTTTGKPFLSHEMTALSVHAACVGGALVMRTLAPLIAHQAGLPSPKGWLTELYRAVGKVHNKAPMIHFLG
jgi:hypothetical protein